MAKLNKNDIVEIVSEKCFITKKEVREILEKCMMGAADMAVELVCDIHTGKTWYELK